MPQQSYSSDRESGKHDRKKSKKKKKSSRRSKSRERSSRSKRSRSSSRRSRSPYTSRSKRSRSKSRRSKRSHSRSRSLSSSGRSYSPYGRSKRSTSRSKFRSPSSSRRSSPYHGSKYSRSPKKHKKDRSSKKSSKYSTSDSSRSPSREKEQSTSKSVRISGAANILSPEAQLNEKIQKALKAAADADAQLRSIGVLNQTSSEGENGAKLSVTDQISRANVITEINSSGFQPKTFMSHQGGVKQPIEDELSGHELALFGKTVNTVSTDLGNKASNTILNLDENSLAHENICTNLDKKREHWFQKLTQMRKSLS